MTSLVANLYKNKSLSESDLDELQAFLDEAKKGR
jgi:predicted transcriptional regulator